MAPLISSPKMMMLKKVMNLQPEEEKPLQAPQGNPFQQDMKTAAQGAGDLNSAYDPLKHSYNALRSAVRRRKI